MAYGLCLGGLCRGTQMGQSETLILSIVNFTLVVLGQSRIVRLRIVRENVI